MQKAWVKAPYQNWPKKIPGAPALLLRVKLGATKGTYIPIVTHNILIIIVLMRKCGPHMCEYVFSWTMEGTVLVYSLKVVVNARVHTRTHAAQYHIPSIPYTPLVISPQMS